jgi:hypothetical protein
MVWRCSSEPISRSLRRRALVQFMLNVDEVVLAERAARSAV